MKKKPSLDVTGLRLRGNLPSPDQLSADKQLDQLGKFDAAQLGKGLPLGLSELRESEIRSGSFSVRFSGGHSADLVRTKQEEGKLIAHNTHKGFDVCGHSCHIATQKPNSMPKPTNQKLEPEAPVPAVRQGYAGKKQRTNISIDGELSKIAQKYFPSTQYGSLSGFVESQLAQLCRRDAKKLRAAGFVLPASLFAK